MNIELKHGDCLEVLKNIPDNSVDSIVTDPPYGLSFMNKKWDYDVPSTDIWVECLRVLKPGGHLLAFSGSRTYHRMAVRIEDAGFDIRDQIMWVYASGFPKSHNISKSLIKLADEKERTEQESKHDLRCVSETDLSQTKSINKEQGEVLFNSVSQQDLSSSINTTNNVWGKKSSVEGWNNLQKTEGELQGSEICEVSSGIYNDGEERRIYNGTQISDGETLQKDIDEDRSSTSYRPQPIKQQNRKSNVISQQFTSQEIRSKAEEFNNYGTALKPAHEPIVMARKPLSEKSVAENVLRWGTGGINIDDSRIEYKGDNDKWKIDHSKETQQTNPQPMGKDSDDLKRTHIDEPHEGGRWPANIIFDEEAGQVLDQQSGISKSNGNTEYNWELSNNDNPTKLTKNIKSGIHFNDKGGASRFFYCPKASKKDRDEGLDLFEDKLSEISQVNSDKVLQPNGEYVEHNPLPRKNNHPTVKPTALMEYLIKLVTPKGGTVLDCFLGSGSTGKAAVRNGFGFIGIEREEEYIKIAEARIKNEL